MAYLIDQILKEISQEIKTILGVAEIPAIEPANPKFTANFALPCFALARDLKKSPQAIAESITTSLKHESLAKIEAQAGFVNFWLSDLAIGMALESVTKDSHKFGTHNHLAGKKLLIEINNPNAFKDLHIGHAYNSIVSDTLANILELGGGDVHRVSYHGDVGLHVGKSMWAILRFIDGDIKKLDSILPEDRPAFLSKMYVEGAGEYDDNPLVRQQIDDLAKQSFIQDDPLFKKVYQVCFNWSFEYFEKAFDRINCKRSERKFLEHETDSLGRQTVESNIDGVFERSEGAVIFRGDKYGLHTRVFISSQNNTLYEARDLGLLRLKNQEYKPDKSYIVTAEEQREYFNVVFKAAELVLPELAGKTVNLPHGTIKLSTGKMSSRTGKVINIDWLFDTIAEAARELGVTDKTTNQTIVGALRYSMLRVRIGGDIIFDINESVSIEGNSGPYLQYAHARGCSILANLDGKASEELIAELTDDERKLATKILAYPEATAKAVTEMAPHQICSYLYELTQQFNRFYEHNRIVGDPRQQVRANLVKAYVQVLANGLGVLSIPAPERV